VEAPRRRAGLTALLAALAVPGCGSDDACRSDVREGVLPEWARAGFTAAEPRMPHAVGESGRIAAVVFGHPLQAPPDERRQNKILWVAREPLRGPAELRITAEQGDRTESRTVDLGPSVVDLPAGCWELTLSWDDREDSLSLVYE
jgi:hypothetical protein